MFALCVMYIKWESDWVRCLVLTDGVYLFEAGVCQFLVCIVCTCADMRTFRGCIRKNPVICLNNYHVGVHGRSQPSLKYHLRHGIWDSGDCGVTDPCYWNHQSCLAFEEWWFIFSVPFHLSACFFSDCKLRRFNVQVVKVSTFSAGCLENKIQPGNTEGWKHWYSSG